MTVYGYLRISTKQQSINNNKAEILLLANKKELGNVIWIQETISGRKDWRKRVLGREFEKMKEGDVIIMSEYSRIGRDFLQSLEFLAECKRKKVEIYSTLGDINMNNTPDANLLLAINAWKAQVERDNLAYRTKIGIAAHKENGSIIGRKKRMVLEKEGDLEGNKVGVKEMLEKDIKLKTIAKEFNTTPTTLRKFINKHDLKKKC